MITAQGRKFIKRYLAGQSGSLVGGMSVGIGNSAAALNDDRMQFEIARVPVTVVNYDFLNDRLIFKGTLDESIEGNLYEVGLWTNEVNTSAANQASRILTSFDSTSEVWDIKTFDTANTRIGVDSLKHTPAASATSTSLLTGITLDLGDFTSLDSFILAYFVGNANAAAVRFRLRTDASNYYEFSIANPTAGYKFSVFQKGTATVVGSPNWGDIGEIQIITVAKAAGSASVQYDGLRIEDVDTIAPEYGLVARSVLATPVIKTEGIVQDFEYALPVNIT